MIASLASLALGSASVLAAVVLRCLVSAMRRVSFTLRFVLCCYVCNANWLIGLSEHRNKSIFDVNRWIGDSLAISTHQPTDTHMLSPSLAHTLALSFSLSLALSLFLSLLHTHLSLIPSCEEPAQSDSHGITNRLEPLTLVEKHICAVAQVHFIVIETRCTAPYR